MKNEFISTIEEDFNRFKFSNEEYKIRLNNLAKILDLKDGFIFAQPPTYFVGDIESPNKIIFMGINPGGKEQNLKFESKFRNENWNSYLDFHKYFFKQYKEGPKIPYYAYLKKCFSPDLDSSSNYFDYCQENFINIDLIPYHSKSFNVKLSDEIEHLYWANFEIIIKFLHNNADLTRYIVVHHKQLIELLSKKNIFNKKTDALPLKLKNKRKVYFKEINGFKILLFSRFIPNGGFSREDVQKALEYINK